MSYLVKPSQTVPHMVESCNAVRLVGLRAAEMGCIFAQISPKFSGYRLANLFPALGPIFRVLLNHPLHLQHWNRW